MSKKIKVNIIGAGISGLSAGCYLQMNGFETQIFEKHLIPGGLCTSWKNGEYTFDGCAHWILGSDKGSSFYKLWSEILDMSSIEFHNHDVRVSIELKNNKNKYGENVFHLYTDLNRLEKYMNDLSPEDAKTTNEFISAIRVMQKYDLPPIMDDLPFFQSMIRGIKMSKYLYFFYWFMKLKNQDNYSFAEKFKSPFLKESFQLLFDGDKVNLVVVCMPLASFDLRSAGYPIGGSLAFAKKIEQSYLSLGGKVNYITPVKKIIVENNVVKGVVVRNNIEHLADVTVSSSDWYHTIFEMLEGKYANQQMIDLSNKKPLDVFYSMVQFSFGINADLSHFPHFFRFPLDEDLVSPDGTVYNRMEIHIYSYDPTMAPKGMTSVVVNFSTNNSSFWVEHRKKKRAVYRAIKDEFLQKVLPILDKKLGGIKDKIEVIDVATPATIERYTNSWKGSTQGWMPGKNIMAPSPVKYTVPNLENFYLASHWNQPGGGLPIAIEAGRNVTKLICKKYGKKFNSDRSKVV